jgi:hypothetical protein
VEGRGLLVVVVVVVDDDDDDDDGGGIEVENGDGDAVADSNSGIMLSIIAAFVGKKHDCNQPVLQYNFLPILLLAIIPFPVY